MMRCGDALLGKIIFRCRLIVQGVSEYILYLVMAKLVLIIILSYKSQGVINKARS